MPETKVYTCSNGLTLIVCERRDTPVVAVHVGVETGSALEAEYVGTGISHLVEHMVFKGTEEYSAREVNERVAAMGGLWNAYTGALGTVFHIHGRSEYWREFLHILLQLTLRPTFPISEWESEREVIRREMEMYDDDPDDVAYRALIRALYKVHPRRWPVIGERARFDTLTREDMLRYHSQRYVPSNMFVCVVGDVEAKRVQEELEKECTGSDVSPQRPAMQPEEEPRQWGPRVERCKFPRSTSFLALAWRTPCRNHPDMPALSLLCSVLGHGRSAWLYRVFHDERGEVHDIDAQMIYHGEGESALVIEADVDSERRDGLRDAVLDYIDKLPQEDFDIALQREKKRACVQKLRRFTTVGRTAEALCASWLSAHNTVLDDEWLEALLRVEPRDLQRVSRLYLNRERITEVSVDPAESAAAESPQSSASRSETDLFLHTTPHGMRCALRVNRGLELIYATLAVGAGTRAEEGTTAGASMLLAELLLKGTTTRSAEQIAAEAENVGASLEASSGENSILISLRCLPQDASRLLGLLADVALHPILDDRSLRTAREDQLADIKQAAFWPDRLALRRLRELCYGAGGYGHTPEGLETSVRRLQRRDLLALHRRVFCAQNATLSLVGDFDVDQMRALFDELFNDMPAGEPLQHPPTPMQRSGEETVHTSGETQQAVVALALPSLPAGHADMPLQLLLESWCTDMSGPLYAELREKQGLVYSVEVECIQGVDRGCLILMPETSPEKLPAARQALENTLQNMARQGMSHEEMERARATVLSAYLLAAQSPEKVDTTTALDMLLGQGPEEAQRTVKVLSEVTYERVQAFVKKMLAQRTPRSVVQVFPMER